MLQHQDRKKGAVTAVLILMMCCFLPMCTIGTDASDTDVTYSIYMRTGQTFTYTPEVNLDDTSIDVDNSQTKGILSDEWSYEGAGHQLSVKFDRIPTTQALLALKAYWQSPDTQVHQTTYQYIDFHIYGHVSVNGLTGTNVVENSVTEYILGTTAWEYPISVGTSPQGTTVTVEQTSGEENVFEYDPSSSKMKVVSGETPSDGTYGFTISATHAVDGTSLVPETAKLYLTLVVGDDLVITSPQFIETYVGDTNPDNLTYTVTTNYDDIDGSIFSTVEKWPSVHEDEDFNTPAGFWNKSLEEFGILSWDPSVVEFPDDVAAADAFKDFTFHAEAMGWFPNGENTGVISQTVTVKVWANLAFTTIPTIDNVTVVKQGTNPLTAKMTVDFSNAQKVVVDWGDGNTEVRDNLTGILNDNLEIPHTYAEGKYFTITVTATNANGSVTAISAYDATSPAISHTVTLKDKDGATVGTVQVEDGQKIDLTKVVYDEDYDMGGKEIKGIYTDQGLSTAFDDPITENKTLYVEIGEKCHWIWIIFLILTIIFAVLFFYFGIQTFYVAIPMAICMVLTILLFVYGDFHGLAIAIEGGMNP